MGLLQSSFRKCVQSEDRGVGVTGSTWTMRRESKELRLACLLRTSTRASLHAPLATLHMIHICALCSNTHDDNDSDKHDANRHYNDTNE